MDLKTYIATAERGTAAKLAAALGVSPSYLSQMARGTAPISAERCVAIERETAGLVTRIDLKPKDWWLIWPELDSQERALKGIAAIDDVQPPVGDGAQRTASYPSDGSADPGFDVSSD